MGGVCLERRGSAQDDWRSRAREKAGLCGRGWLSTVQRAICGVGERKKRVRAGAEMISSIWDVVRSRRGPSTAQPGARKTSAGLLRSG